jgi:hypothetical protein
MPINNIQYDHTMVKAVFQLDENNSPYGRKHIDNITRSINTPYTYAIVDLGIPGHSALYKFGSNPDVDTASETIWTEGGLYPWAGIDAAPGVVTISSTSNDDTHTTGTGARTCTIYGLSTAGITQNETVSLTGQTAVNSTLQYSRVNRIICNTAGTGLANAGKIYVGTGIVSTGTPAVKWAVAEIGLNQTLQTVWTVPTGKTLYVTRIAFSTNNNKGAIIDFFVKPPGQLFQIKTRNFLFSSPINVTFTVPLKIDSMSDIDVRGIGTGSGGGIAAIIEGWYE